MFGTALLVGGAFGVHHAFEADHVAAVATLVEAEDRPASTGAAWGVGHSLPILALGALFLALDLRVPSTVATGFEEVKESRLQGLKDRLADADEDTEELQARIDDLTSFEAGTSFRTRSGGGS